MVKSPLWESTPGALIALINSGKFVYSTLITISFNASSDFAPHQITQADPELPDWTPSWAPDSSKIIFTRTSGITFNDDLYTIKPDGSALTLIITAASLGKGSVSTACYSPDGTKIVFQADNDIYTANADGSSPALIMSGGFYPNWGSNNKIVFYKTGPNAIWTMNPDGSGAVSLFTLPMTFGAEGAPKWSPDATQILYTLFDASTATNQIWVSDAAGSVKSRLTNCPGVTLPSRGWIGSNASWTPNGQRISFTGAMGAADNGVTGWGLHMMGADGSKVHRIYTPVNKWAGDTPSNPPPWGALVSPDGNWIVYDLQPHLDQAFVGLWIFKVPVPLKLRESMPIAAAGNAPVENIYLTDADVDIKLYSDGPVWDSKSVRIDHANSQMNAHWKRGLDTDQAIITFAPRLKNEITGADFPDKIGNTPWVQAALRGVFAGCDVQVDRAYFPDWGSYEVQKTPTGVLTIFAGNACEVDCTDTSVVMTLNDYREFFTTMIPPDVFEGQCKWKLFDAGCRLIESLFKDSGTLVGGSTQKLLVTTAVTASGSGTFVQGKVRITSGLNKGFVRTITNAAGNEFSLMNPLPFTVEIGDSFDIFPGCNKTTATCTLFGNLANHGGFTTIPTATAAI